MLWLQEDRIKAVRCDMKDMKFVEVSAAPPGISYDFLATQSQLTSSKKISKCALGYQSKRCGYIPSTAHKLGALAVESCNY